MLTILRAGNLIAVVEIVDGMEDRVVVLDVDDRPVRETRGSCWLGEDLPFALPWKSSHMKKPPRSRYSRSIAPARRSTASSPSRRHRARAS